MKKTILLFLLACGLAMGLGSVPNATATALPISTYWNLGYPAGTGPGGPYLAGPGDWTGDSDGDSLTSVFDQIQYFANTTSTQYDTDSSLGLSVGDVFVDVGNADATNLLPKAVPQDTEGLGFTYEFTFAWTDLTGHIQEINPGGTTDTVITRYTSGSIDFYLDTSIDATFGSDNECAGDDTGFTDGTLVATVSNITGLGHSNFVHNTTNFEGGDYHLTGQFTYLINDFWFEDTGEDLLEKYVSLNWLLGYTAGDVDQAHFTQYPGGPSDPVYGDALYQICSNHDSSFELQVIPEPATMLLLGSGLIGLAGLGRKKFFKKG